MSLTFVYLCWIILCPLSLMTLKILLCWSFPMASEDDKIDLSSVAVTDLRKSVENLCQGSTLPPYNYDFPECFVQHRDLHFSHFSITRIDGLKFFCESEYSGKSCPRFEQKEVTMTFDFVATGRWLWFAPEQPSVSESSVVSSVSQADQVRRQMILLLLRKFCPLLVILH